MLHQHDKRPSGTWLFLVCLFLLFASARAFPPQQPQLNIAAASDLKFALTELASAFEKQSGAKLNLTYGSSGNFFAQIKNGAPFDVFFSADSGYPHRLDTAGLVVTNSIYEYAVGRLVLWVPAGSKIDLSKSGMNALLDPSVQKIAIANPANAPYGRAAAAALGNAGLQEKVKDKLVIGENISQAAQFAQSGNAQIGIIALSLAVSPPLRSGKYWEIPQRQYFPLIQSAVVLKRCEQKDLALSFLKFVASPPGTKILEDFGFAKPQFSVDDRAPLKPY